jgi:hypothetical protein
VAENKQAREQLAADGLAELVVDKGYHFNKCWAAELAQQRGSPSGGVQESATDTRRAREALVAAARRTHL